MPLILNSIYVWVIIVIVAVAIEAITLDLFSIWFAVGALGAVVTATFGGNLAAQLIVFVVLSALLLILVRPFSRRFLQIKGEKTNADRIIDQTAIVTKAIDNAQAQGEIKLLGQYWTARSVDDTQIPTGALVRVLTISGVKAIVETVDTQNKALDSE